MGSDSIQLSSSSEIHWRLVVQRLGGKLLLYDLKLQRDDDGPTIMRKLHEEYGAISSNRPFSLANKFLLFQAPIIETAALSTNSATDLEACQDAPHVFVVRREANAELTAAFYDPEILSGSSNFLGRNDHLYNSHHGGRFEKKVILVALKTTRTGIALFVLLNVFLCLGSGVLVGMLTRRVDLGVAVTSAVAAVLACLQAYLLLFSKQIK